METKHVFLIFLVLIIFDNRKQFSKTTCPGYKRMVVTWIRLFGHYIDLHEKHYVCCTGII